MIRDVSRCGGRCGGQGSRWGSTRAARLGGIGQEKGVEIWLLLCRKAGKPLGHGQWDFKAAKAVRNAQATCRNLTSSKPSHSSWVHMTQGPHSSTVL